MQVVKECAMRILRARADCKVREKNPHRQLHRCLWGFQKGEDKYLTLSLVQSFHFIRKKEVGAFLFRIMIVLTVFSPLYNLL